MKKVVFGAIFLGAVSISFAQAPAGSHEITVKSSPAEDALIEQSKQQADTAKTLNNLLQQARANLDKINKPIVEEMQKRAKVYQDKITLVNKDLQDKLEKNSATASATFQKETAGLQAKAVSPQTITALSEVVKKEQGLPENSVFDPVTQKWTVPDAKK